jgi:hypothetical protein
MATGQLLSFDQKAAASYVTVSTKVPIKTGRSPRSDPPVATHYRATVRASSDGNGSLGRIIDTNPGVRAAL